MTSNGILNNGADLLDCAILRAGPAGLTALTYLARFHRRVVAPDGSHAFRPRLLLIERSYNLPGYPQGIVGSSLLQNLRDQAHEVGGEVRAAATQQVDGNNGSFTLQLEDGSRLRARKLILAIGVHDREPDIPGISAHIGYFCRYCPVCDGYEHSGKRLGILGCGAEVARHALFLRAFSDRITVFLHGQSQDTLGHYADVLNRRGVAVHEPRVVCVLEEKGDPESEHRGRGICLEDGSEHPLSVLYNAV